MRRHTRRVLVGVAAIVGIAAFVGPGGSAGGLPPASGAVLPAVEPTGIRKLDHLVFIVQENRSVDQYFARSPVRTVSRVTRRGA